MRLFIFCLITAKLYQGDHVSANIMLSLVKQKRFHCHPISLPRNDWQYNYPVPSLFLSPQKSVLLQSTVLKCMCISISCIYYAPNSKRMRTVVIMGETIQRPKKFKYWPAVEYCQVCHYNMGAYGDFLTSFVTPGYFSGLKHSFWDFFLHISVNKRAAESSAVRADIFNLIISATWF